MNERVLVVEDDEDTLEMLTAAIRNEGYEVLQARSGSEAIRFISSADIALLDRMLPDMDGLQVCEEARKSTDIPIVVLSCLARDTDKVKGFEAGVDDYIAKPFHPTEVLARIRAHLRRRSRATNGHALPAPRPLNLISADFGRSRTAQAMQVLILAMLGWALISLVTAHARLLEYQAESLHEVNLAAMERPLENFGTPARVVAIDRTSRQLVLERTLFSGESAIRTIRVPESAVLQIGGRAAPLQELKVGMRVRMRGLLQDGSGAWSIRQLTASPPVQPALAQ